MPQQKEYAAKEYLRMNETSLGDKPSSPSLINKRHMKKSLLYPPSKGISTMRVIIAGAGEVGRGVAMALRAEKRQVALIDPDPVAINESQSIDCLLVTGNALSRDSLLRAGINDAEIVVLCTNNDEVNLLGCAFAKRVYSEQVGDRATRGLTTIATIRDPTLLDKNRGAGPLERWTRADHVVCASDDIVKQLAAGLLAPSVEEILPLGDNAWIAVAEVMPNSALIGKTTGEVDQWIVNIPSVYGIKSGDDKGILVSGSEVILEGDMLCFVARSTEEFLTITTGSGLQDPEWPNSPLVAIFGATKFGKKLAAHYLESGAEVVVIEPDLDSANELVGSPTGNSKRLDVIHGDPQDEELLRELSIDTYDVAIAALKDDNLNIAISMRAKDKGVARTGLILKDRALVEAVQRIGLTRPVSRRHVTVISILKSIHMNVPGAYQVIPQLPDIISISATISHQSYFIGRTIQEAEKKLGCRIVMVEKEDDSGTIQILNPSDVDILNAGDKVLVFLKRDDMKHVEKTLGS
jgi:trk system potassium uptake protein TrkA